MNTKTNRVKKHLEKQGSITTWQAFQLYGATRLSAIIYNLRKRGYKINNNWKEEIDRNGEKTRYVEYKLDVEQMVKENDNHIPHID